MTQPELVETRERMRRLIEHASQDPQFRSVLQSDPQEALNRFDLKIEDVRASLPADNEHLTQPPGCADFTCIASECPGTCWVTIPQF